MNTTEHPAVHADHLSHGIFWGKVRSDAEEYVKGILEGGNEPSSLMIAIGKASIDSPEDWDDLRDYCEENGITCRELHKLDRAFTMWMQAYNELEYKKLYP